MISGGISNVIQRRIFVSGRVQGVGFRAFVYRKARSLSGLRGFVRNLSDGRVEAVFVGSQESVSKMFEYCRKGPLAARVVSCEMIEENPDFGLPEFEIFKGN